MQQDSPKKDFAGFGALKHLLRMVDDYSKRMPGKVSVTRVRALLEEIRPKGTSNSKWDSFERVGQAELYDACEKVVDTLRNHKQHSFPFLNKVTKREAPDYLNIIKNPMDLGTVHKKMKNFQYNSKAEFAADLQLIWDNCFQYNTDPNSVFRSHASAMQDKARHLLKRVPNIRIRQREETEVDAASDSDDYTSLMHDGTTVHGDFDEDMDSVMDAEGNGMADMHLDGAESVNGDQMESMDGTVQRSSTSEESSVALLPPVSSAVLRHRVVPSLMASSDQDLADEISIDDQTRFATDPLSRSIIMATWETRAETIAQRARDQSLPFPDRDPLLRTAADMQLTESQRQSYLMRKQGLRRKTKPGDKNALDDADLLFMPEYQLTSSLPVVPFTPVTAPESPERMLKDQNVSDAAFLFAKHGPKRAQQGQPSFATFASVYPGSTGMLAMAENIKRYRHCRRLEHLLIDAVIKTPGASPVVLEAPRASHHLPLLTFPQPPQNAQSGCPAMDPESAQNLLQRSLAIILLHAGLDGSSQSAMQALNHIVADYLEMIGRLYRSYCDQYARTMTMQEILEHVLCEAGAPTPAHIYATTMTDVKRTNKKLGRVQNRLDDLYNVITSPSVPEQGADQDAMDDDAAFVMGDFGRELGDDYLGLKALGVPDGVPEALWNTEGRRSSIRGRRDKAGAMRRILANYVGEETAVADVAISGDRYPTLPPFPSFRDATEMVGLLKPHFEQKLQQAPGGVLIDVRHNKCGLIVTVKDEFLQVKNKTRRKKKKVKVVTRKLKQGTPLTSPDRTSNAYLSGDDLMDFA